MISQETKKLLEQLGASSYGRALRDYLDERLDDIGDITKVNSWEETLGKKYAIRLIKEIFGILEEKKIINKQPNPYE